MNENSPPRSFAAHVAQTAAHQAADMLSGLYESIEQFLALERAPGDRAQEFEPSRSHEWLTAAYAAAVAHGPADPADPADATGYAYTLAVYVEGDVTRYRFRRFEDAARAGQLWALGLD